MSQTTAEQLTKLTCPACLHSLPRDAEACGPTRLYGCPKCLNIGILYDGNNGRIGEALDGMPTIELLAPPGSVMEGVLKHLNRALEELPVLPQVPMRVLQTMHDPLTSMSDLAEIIDEDPAISLKVLRIANSALYRGTHEIKDLHVACARLGMKTVGNVVHTVAQRNVYRTDNPAFRDAMDRLWRHAVASAHAAEAVGVIVGPGRFPAAFVAGLVHDIGKLLLLEILSHRYKGRLGRLQDSQDLLQKVLHHFHSYVGVHVVQYWRLPPELGFTTFYCDRPDRAPIDTWRELTHIVAIGSAIADSLGYGFAVREIDFEEHPSVKELGIMPAPLNECRERLEDELEKTLEAFASVS